MAVLWYRTHQFMSPSYLVLHDDDDDDDDEDHVDDDDDDDDDDNDGWTCHP